jgi:hypothetical protein
LRSLSGVRTAAAVGRENPILDAAVKKSAVIYDEISLRDYITEEKRAELGRQLFLEINEICNAANPILACRDKLATTMLKFARYQVLVIPPPPEEDPSGLRGRSCKRMMASAPKCTRQQICDRTRPYGRFCNDLTGNRTGSWERSTRHASN